MLSLSNHQRYFLYRDVVDMRKGIDGLSGLVRDYLKLDPLSGDVYLFLNRKRNQVKLLMWDKDGFALYYKRLEAGTYELPVGSDTAIGMDVLLCILQGIRLTAMRKRKRYEQAT
ncbi:MAG TPA: IS66 family insertion sequence element accessory protein TnpB [Chitinophagales bacterium]|nr:IS66 family insertion sequence element accessory protein TnpB [Chitinophagales bacterium]HNE47455.1 IS66 family insertion sequence element accessory protein TnpB [Chitinophagales bacterium]HNF70473.1 IS66 family insertion sequence element accessory protein TnpB [Chitinophagales bacterium]HNO30075.1 IS66 family insertion sequence element accessory protein TnpB [Chitinophagales bacterium]